MKTILLLLLILTSSVAFAERTGLGIALGSPFGLSAKRWLGETTAVDAGLGMSIGRRSHLSVHSDYLFHRLSDYYLNEEHPLDLYYGIGGRMKFADDIQIGVRLPVGVAHLIKSRNADVFFEAAPVFDFISRMGIDLNLLLGARYYF
jgi:hypothetical protein